MTPIQPHKADSGAARTSAGRSQKTKHGKQPPTHSAAPPALEAGRSRVSAPGALGPAPLPLLPPAPPPALGPAGWPAPPSLCMRHWPTITPGPRAPHTPAHMHATPCCSSSPTHVSPERPLCHSPTRPLVACRPQTPVRRAATVCERRGPDPGIAQGGLSMRMAMVVTLLAVALWAGGAAEVPPRHRGPTWGGLHTRDQGGLHGHALVQEAWL